MKRTRLATGFLFRSLDKMRMRCRLEGWVDGEEMTFRGNHRSENPTDLMEMTRIRFASQPGRERWCPPAQVIAEKALLGPDTRLGLLPGLRVRVGPRQGHSLLGQKDCHEFQLEDNVVGTFRGCGRSCQTKGTVEAGDVGHLLGTHEGLRGRMILGLVGGTLLGYDQTEDAFVIVLDLVKRPAQLRDQWRQVEVSWEKARRRPRLALDSERPLLRISPAWTARSWFWGSSTRFQADRVGSPSAAERNR